MTSIRTAIQQALVARLGAIAGWNAQLRGPINRGDHPIKAVVFLLAEDKRPRNNEVYFATMLVGVELTVRAEDASATLDLDTTGEPNPFLYLDRMVVLAEKAIHVPDNGWGINPGFDDVWVNGHDVGDPADDNEISALIRLSITYRHHFQDPEA